MGRCETQGWSSRLFHLREEGLGAWTPGSEGGGAGAWTPESEGGGAGGLDSWIRGRRGWDTPVPGRRALAPACPCHDQTPLGAGFHLLEGEPRLSQSRQEAQMGALRGGSTSEGGGHACLAAAARLCSFSPFSMLPASEAEAGRTQAGSAPQPTPPSPFQGV